MGSGQGLKAQFSFNPLYDPIKVAPDKTPKLDTLVTKSLFVASPDTALQSPRTSVIQFLK
jgi:hypothetical protein